MLLNKIKSVLSLYDKSLADWSRHLGIYPQSLNNKIKKEAIKLTDFIEMADMIGCKVCIVKDNDIIMTFDKSDLKKEP